MLTKTGEYEVRRLLIGTMITLMTPTIYASTCKIGDTATLRENKYKFCSQGECNTLEKGTRLKITRIESGQISGMPVYRYVEAEILGKEVVLVEDNTPYSCTPLIRKSGYFEDQAGYFWESFINC